MNAADLFIVLSGRVSGLEQLLKQHDQYLEGKIKQLWLSVMPHVVMVGAR